MKITIAGSGAMGSRFGAALFEAGHDVVLLDGWREHVTAINQTGLRVTDATGTRTLAVPAVLFSDPAPPPSSDPAPPPASDPAPPPASDPAYPSPSSDDPADLVIVFAKATTTALVAAAADAAGAIGPSTLVLTLQNGLGNVESLLAYVPADRLLAGTTTLGTELLGPGHIRALGSGETVLGPLSAESSPAVTTTDDGQRVVPGAGTGDAAVMGSAGRIAPGLPGSDAAGRVGSEPAERIALALDGAGISARTSPDALEVIWAKVAFNCVMNSLCSIASIPVSALARYDGFDALAGSVLDEVAAVAAAEGVIVDTAAALRVMHAQFDPSASGDHLASMLQDLMNGRPTEIAQLNGAIAARAAARGIDAPVNTAIARLVGLLEATWTGRVNRLHPEPS